MVMMLFYKRDYRQFRLQYCLAVHVVGRGGAGTRAIEEYCKVRRDIRHRSHFERYFRLRTVCLRDYGEMYRQYGIGVHEQFPSGKQLTVELFLRSVLTAKETCASAD